MLEIAESDKPGVVVKYRREGTTAPVSGSATPVASEHGTPIHALCVFVRAADCVRHVKTEPVGRGVDVALRRRYLLTAAMLAGHLQLSVQWAFQTASLGQFEATPLLIADILYGTGQDNRAFALDARTGRAIWRYQRQLPDKLQPCCGMANRGFAALGDKLFMATLDAHLIALDRKTGNVIWDVQVRIFGTSSSVQPFIRRQSRTRWKVGSM